MQLSVAGSESRRNSAQAAAPLRHAEALGETPLTRPAPARAHSSSRFPWLLLHPLQSLSVWRGLRALGVGCSAAMLHGSLGAAGAAAAGPLLLHYAADAAV
jgi:hypothetical protein